jgi:hypothetical protein
MKPGKSDRKHQLLITGAELQELKELDLVEPRFLPPRSNMTTRRCRSSPRSSPDRAWNWIDLIVLITKVSPEPVVRAMTIAFLLGLTPKIMRGLWQKPQGKLEVTPTRQFTLTILVRRPLVPKAILRVCARNLCGSP